MLTVATITPTSGRDQCQVPGSRPASCASRELLAEALPEDWLDASPSWRHGRLSTLADKTRPDGGCHDHGHAIFLPQRNGTKTISPPRSATTLLHSA